MKKWRTRDWIWLVSILVGLIILVITIRLDDNDSVVNMISLLASASSITLAIVAIFQSSNYNKKSDEIFESFKNELNILKQNTDIIKENLLEQVTTTLSNDKNISMDNKFELKNKIKDTIMSNTIMLKNLENYSSQSTKDCLDDDVLNYELVYNGATTSGAIEFFKKNKDKFGEVHKANMIANKKNIDYQLILINNSGSKMIFRGGLTSGYNGEGPSGTQKVLKMAGFNIEDGFVQNNACFELIK